MQPAFNEDARRRISKTVRRVENTPTPPRESGGAHETWTDEILIGKADATAGAIAQGTTGKFNVYRGTTKGSETYTTGDDKQVYARLGNIPTTGWTYIAYRAGGWEAINTQNCS